MPSAHVHAYAVGVLGLNLEAAEIFTKLFEKGGDTLAFAWYLQA